MANVTQRSSLMAPLEGVERDDGHGRCALSFDNGLEELDGLSGLCLVQEDAATEFAGLVRVAIVCGDDSIERSPRAADLAHEGLLEHGRLPTCTRVNPRPAAVRLGRKPFA
eukprot:scaffold77932_cov71-Phaeocystis_antarctica.AAC.2